MANRRDQRRAKKRKQREQRIKQRRERERAGDPGDVFGDLFGDVAEPAPPSPFETERVFRAQLEGDPFEGLEDLPGELGSARAAAERLTNAARRAMGSKAQDLAFEALEASSRQEAERLARAALALDPDCCDARSLLALHGQTAAARVRGLREALEAGERALGGPAFLEENAGRFWGLVETRPYMRARLWLAENLRELGEVEEAELHYRELLRLNPNDNQGVRSELVGLLLELADAPAAAEVLDRFDDSYLAISAWSRTLERLLSGDVRGAARARRRATAKNPHVEPALLGRGRRPRSASHYALGSEEEAAYVLDLLGRAWRQSPTALAWLADGGPATTPEERRHELASYTGPFLRLLDEGAPGFHSDSPWFDAPGEFTSEHVDELLRMATSEVLPDCPGDERWAPIHARRVLAALGDERAVAPLLAVAREALEEDEEPLDLPHVLGALGSAVVGPAIELYADRTATEFARTLALQALRVAVEAEDAPREPIVEALLEHLRRFEEHDNDLNAWTIDALVELAPEAARERERELEEMFAAYRVTQRLIGSWEEVLERLR